jgi:hypothetical protein
MQDIELCNQLLKLEEPWHAETVGVDAPSQRVDITLNLGTAKKSLFKRGSTTCPRCQRLLPVPQEGVKTLTLRHLNFGGMRTYLQIPAPETYQAAANACVCQKLWGKPGARFTHEMEDHIVETLKAVRATTAAAKILGITTAEAAEINARTGAIAAETPPPVATPAAPAAVTVSATPAAPAAITGPPPENHPIWMRLVNSEVMLQTNAVNLKMLLEQIRLSIASHPTDIARLAGVRVLRQFFGKYWNRFQGEFAPLLGTQVGMAAQAAGAAGAEVPADNDRCWQKLIDGQLEIKTEAIGLKMLLERVRLSLGSGATAMDRLASARVLRQFFLKYQTRLRNEIRQLQAAAGSPGESAAPAPAAAAGGVPAETDAGWGRWIKGEVEVRTGHIGLTMMLERVRLSLGEFPSPAQVLAGARVLRQFFLKYQSRLRPELEQLHKLSGGVAAAQAAVHIPPDIDSSWARWIRGEIDIRTEAVGLSMLLERVRLSIGDTPTEAQLLAGARFLRQFFVKYGPRLRGELEQLLRLGGGPLAVMSGSGQVIEFVEVPSESHPSWQRLICGDMDLRTDALSLKMLLERIRLSMGASPSEASQLAGARILRQYFIKYRNRHRAELEQLKVA